MTKTILLIASLALFTAACSQKKENFENKTEIKTSDSADADTGYEINADINTTENYEMLIPDGYDLLSKTEGDLNNDGIMDLILVVKSQQEKKDEMPGDDVSGRILMLLTKDNQGLYSRAAENTKAILAKNEGGAGSDDPFQNIEVSPGKFMISHLGGAAERWSYEDVFTYDKASNAWFLTEKNKGSFSAMNPADEKMEKETPKDFGKINFIDFKQ